MSITLRAKKTAGAFAAAATALFLTATPAHAATFNVTDNCAVPWIKCSEGDLWVLYNTKANAVVDGRYVTSWATFYGNVYDYYGTSQYQGTTLTTYRYVFNGNGKGAWQYVKNNAGSVENCSTVDNYRVYFNSGHVGHSQYFPHRGAYAGCTIVNLDSTLHDNNASQHFA